MRHIWLNGACELCDQLAAESTATCPGPRTMPDTERSEGLDWSHYPPGPERVVALRRKAAEDGDAALMAALDLLEQRDAALREAVGDYIQNHLGLHWCTECGRFHTNPRTDPEVVALVEAHHAALSFTTTDGGTDE